MKRPSCSKLEAETGAEGGSKPAVVLFGTSWLILLRRGPSTGPFFPPPLAFYERSHQNGRSPYWPETPPTGLGE